MDVQEPIVRKKLSHEVRDRLLQMIEAGQFKPGDRLPSEHELMSSFQVGRPAVREALQSLESMNLVVIQHGERARVSEPSAEGLIAQIEPATRQLLNASSQNLEHLKEARQAFETGIVRIAIQKRTPEQIQRLKDAVESMRSSKGTPNFREYDKQFHTILAEMTGNPILLASSKAFLKWLSGFYQNLLEVKGLEDLTIEEHEEIAKYVESGDVEKAVQAVSDHILRVNALYNCHTNSN